LVVGDVMSHALEYIEIGNSLEFSFRSCLFWEVEHIYSQCYINSYNSVLKTSMEEAVVAGLRISVFKLQILL
jgi:hypothetical protein